MRLIIAGTRDLPNAQAQIDSFMAVLLPRIQARFGKPVSAVATGCSGAVDLAGRDWALRHGYVPGKTLIDFPYPSPREMAENGVDLSKLKNPWRAGGPIRNGWQAAWAAEEPDSGLVLVWTGDPVKSSGSADMKRQATAARLWVAERVVARPET